MRWITYGSTSHWTPPAFKPPPGNCQLQDDLDHFRKFSRFQINDCWIAFTNGMIMQNIGRQLARITSQLITAAYPPFVKKWKNQWILRWMLRTSVCSCWNFLFFWKINFQNIVTSLLFHCQNIVILSLFHCQNIVVLLSKHCQNIVETLSKHRQNIVETLLFCTLLKHYCLHI